VEYQPSAVAGHTIMFGARFTRFNRIAHSSRSSHFN